MQLPGRPMQEPSHSIKYYEMALAFQGASLFYRAHLYFTGRIFILLAQIWFRVRLMALTVIYIFLGNQAYLSAFVSS